MTGMAQLRYSARWGSGLLVWAYREQEWDIRFVSTSWEMGDRTRVNQRPGTMFWTLFFATSASTANDFHRHLGSKKRKT